MEVEPEPVNQVGSATQEPAPAPASMPSAAAPMGVPAPAAGGPRPSGHWFLSRRMLLFGTPSYKRKTATRLGGRLSSSALRPNGERPRPANEAGRVGFPSSNDARLRLAAPLASQDAR